MKQRIEEEKMLMPRLYRFMGNSIAKRLAHSPLTPNQVTFFGIFVGLAAAFAILEGGAEWMVVAAILLQLNVVLDYVDGSLAHLKGMGSVLGDWLGLKSWKSSNKMGSPFMKATTLSSFA